MSWGTIRKSIRWQLPLSYAAIALLSTIALGTVLLIVLRTYYGQREYDYLQGNANTINSVIMQMVEEDMPPAAIQAHLETYSFLAQVRVRYLNVSGEVLADSGIPLLRNVLTISARPEVAQPQANPNPTARPPIPSAYPDEDANYAASYNPGAFTDINYPPNFRDDYGPFIEPPGLVNYPLFTADLGIPIELPPDSTNGAADYYTPVIILNFVRVGGSESPSPNSTISQQGSVDAGFVSVLPATSTLYGFDLGTERTGDNQRSDQLYTETILGSNGEMLGYLELSNGPAYSGKILQRVANGWIIASALAVVLAGIVGWRISRRISVPLVSLTAATQHMASGDLSARAQIQRDDELGVLSTSFNQMAQQVEETIKALRHFVADAAHELHTPLTALRTNMELAADEPNDDTRYGYIMRAETQIQRLESLTDSLLDLSRIEAGDKKDNQQKDLCLSALLREISELYASRSEQAGLNFSLYLPEKPITIHGNATQLRCAVGNLLDNAIKFTPVGESIQLQLREQKHYIEIEVRDKGIGIPSDELPLIFSRFHRGRNAVVYPGNGLGLAIVKGVVERHGGQISAYNMSPGTSFLLRLPLP